MLVLTHYNTVTLLVLASPGHNTSSAALLSTRLSVLPCYNLERSPSFYPEQYSVGGLFGNPLFVIAMKQQNHFTQQYHLIFSQSPRCWKRVIVTATFKSIRTTSALMQVLSPDNLDGTFKEFPNAVNTALSAALAQFNSSAPLRRVHFP